MTMLPLIRDTTPGIYQVCATANTDYVLTVPEGATGLIVWFEASAADATVIRGRIGIDQAATPVTGMNGSDALLGYHPPMPVEYELVTHTYRNRVESYRDAYVHLASGTAGAVVRGMWLFRSDEA